MDVYNPIMFRPIVYVDTQEKRSGIVKLLEERGVEVCVKKLDACDYQIGSEWGFERKTVEDLASSIIKKRVFKQIHHLVSAFPRPVFLIEGEPDRMRRLPKEAYFGFLGYLLLHEKLRLAWTTSTLDTAILLSTIAKQGVFGVREPSSFYKKKAETPFEEVMRVLQALPGIGEKRALLLRDTFGSLYNLFNADEEELAEVLGKRGRYLYQLFRKEYF